MDILSLFHPLIAGWFRDCIGRPTEVQEQAWPKIANGEHILITAPTGSGKTLTAFLWAINQLVTGTWDIGHTSVLYVSPLKALNNDIQRNLLTPLGELREIFQKEEEFFPQIRVLTRSGDTPQSDRRRMQRYPPEILITTPESLNLLLSSLGGRSILTSLSTVILDEIHAVLGSKRDTHLITAVDRLVPLTGEFQRIALSATIRPLSTVAEFVGGYTMEGDVHHPRYVSRPVSLVRSDVRKDYDVRVRFPDEAPELHNKESVWKPMVAEFKTIIGHNRSTLLFANSRRLCEKLTLKINKGEESPVAYAHHGSLSREIREEVERKLKAGELRAIVATNSLEMGIDIGALDEVVLIQCPPSVSSAIQRIGRAGHQVGEVSRGAIFPTHSLDFLESAVLAAAIRNQDIEAIRPVDCPLDVLAQVIVSMVGVETWDIDELYAILKTSYPYRNLSRQQFDLVLNMLGGRYADSRVRELKPRVSIDRLDNTVAARKGSLLALYMSGGTIPDRGYFHLRHFETNARIGELDEEFVWEASVGQIFTLGTQNWKIERITHNDVFVVPANPQAIAPPFWRGEEIGRDFHFSMRIARFLEEADTKLDDPDYTLSLMHENFMDKSAADHLIAFLKRQKEATQCALPYRRHLLVEHISAGPGGAPGNQIVLHTMWGGMVNRPLAMALGAAWEERFGQRIEAYAGNDCIVFLLPHEMRGEELLSLVTASMIEPLLRKRLEGSGFFGARFRECAGRSLLLTRNKMNERMPLWMSRLRSQKLLDSVLRYDDFPILIEAWRTCLHDEFDLESLQTMLAELESGAIQWSEAYTHHPSPFAQTMSWGQINKYMYMDDESPSGKSSRLREDLLRDVVFSPGLRPTVSRRLADQFEAKRKRVSPGYSPETSRDLLDWVKERVIIPASEWKTLLAAIERDYGQDTAAVPEPIAEKIVRVTPAEAREPYIAALERMPGIIHALYSGTDEVRIEFLTGGKDAAALFSPGPKVLELDRDELLASVLCEWMQFYGPVTVSFIDETLGIDRGRLLLALEDLVDSRSIITGNLLTDEDDDFVCDAENFEVLLRMARAEAAPAFEPLEAKWLPVFLASFQGVVYPGNDIDELFRRIEQLLCHFAPAPFWESEVFPARLRSYQTSWLDTITQEGDLRWIGGENRRVAFYFETDLDLMREEDRDPGKAIQETGDVEQAEDDAHVADDLFPDAAGRYDFAALLRSSGYNAARLSDILWDHVWAGRAANDTFAALRKGIENRFKIPAAAETSVRTHIRGRRPGRSGFTRWKTTLPSAGSWYRIVSPVPGDDLLEMEERNKDRVRLLLDRYGILFRELLQNEAPAFRWPNIFRSLRIMELSGEVLAGYFFHGIAGLQFISHQAFRMLQRKLPEDAVYWMNGVDPASLCGVRVEGVKSALPRRVSSTHLVYQGPDLVMESRKSGKELIFHTVPDHPRFQEFLAPLRHLLTRQFKPLRNITIETINGDTAAGSPYINGLRTGFDVVVDYKNITLYRNPESRLSV